MDDIEKMAKRTNKQASLFNNKGVLPPASSAQARAGAPFWQGRGCIRVVLPLSLCPLPARHVTLHTWTRPQPSVESCSPPPLQDLQRLSSGINAAALTVDLERVTSNLNSINISTIR